MRGFLISGTVCFILFLLFPYLPIALVYATLFIGVVGLIVFSLIKRSKQKDQAIACFFVFAASLVFILNYYSVAKPAEELSGNAELIGTIISGPEKAGEEYKYTVKIKTVNGKRFFGSAEVFSGGGIEGEGGDIVEVSGKIRKIENEGFFNAKAYYYSKGVFIKLEALENGRVVGKNNFRASFLGLSKKISLLIKETVGADEGALLAGIVANDKGALSKDANENIRAAGYSHLINVSGLHLSIVSSFLFLIFYEILMKKRKPSAILTCVMILIYMAITGFSVSSIRAGIMLIIYYFGMLVERESDSKNSLGAAVTIILLLNPYAATNASFLLSTLSTFGIIVSTDFILRLSSKRKISKKQTKILMFLSPAFSAVLFSAPASMMLFGSVNLISPVSNLALFLLITPIVIIGIILAILLLVSGTNVLTEVVGFIAGIICKIILFLASIFSKIPLSLPVNGVFARVMVFLVVLLILVLMLNFKKKRLAFIVCAVVIALSGVGSVFERRDKLEDSLWLLSGEDYKSYVYISDKRASIFGAESYKGARAAAELLNSLGIKRVEYFYLENASPITLSAADYIIEDFSVEKIIVPKASADYEGYNEKLITAAQIESEGFRFSDKNVILIEKASSRVTINLGDENKSFPFAVEIAAPNGKITRFSSSPLAEREEKYYNNDNEILSVGIFRFEFLENERFKEVKTLVGYYG